MRFSLCWFVLLLLVLGVGGVYVSAICWSLVLSCPLSSKRFNTNSMAFLASSGEEERRWQRQSSPLKAEMEILGSWHE